MSLNYFYGLDEPWFQGATTTTEVPGFFPVALGGRPYLVDINQLKLNTVPIRREQADTSESIGEQSLSREDLWRRSIDDWTAGGGQEYYDRGGGNPRRFNTSKGIDPWTRWQISLLPDTFKKRNSSNTNLFIVAAGTRYYITDSTSVLFTTTITSTDDFTTVTGTSGTPQSITSDGFNVWTAHGSSGIFNTNTGISTASQWRTGTVELVGFAKGRLIATNDQFIYDVSTGGGGALPTALNSATTLPSTWTWVGVTEGSSFIFVGGFAGDKSLIYRTSVRADGTALDAPVVAGELPDGEILRSLQGYLGFMVLGTDMGVRFATIDGNGNLTVGKLIDVGASVRAFEPQDRFVWFGWPNFDSTSTGLGRLDLSVFTDPLTPAFASDLMATAQGTTLGVITFSERRIFTVSGNGVFLQDTNLVSSGRLDSGKITYGMSDDKVAMFVDLRHDALNGTIQVSRSTDEETLEVLGTSSTAGETSLTLPAGEEIGSAHELRYTLSRSSADTTLGPVLTITTLRVQPAPPRSRIFFLPILLHEKLQVRDQERTINPLDEFNALQGMIDGKSPVTFQDGSVTRKVFVEDLEFTPDRRTLDNSWWNGLCLVKLKEVVS